MHLKHAAIYLPSIENVIDRCPLTVTPDTLLSEVITMMGQTRSSCLLNNFMPASQELNLMGEARASCVLVIENSQVLGIFTERDLVRLIASGRLNSQQQGSINQIRMGEVMTQPVFTLTQSIDQDIFTALLLLRQHRIRHLPIINNQQQLIGVVTPESIRQAILQPANLLQGRRVKEVMTPEVFTADAQTSVLNIAQIMAKQRVSCIVITKKINQDSNYNNMGKKDTQDNNVDAAIEDSLTIPVGMITERDIVQFQALDLNLSNLIAENVMSTPLFCLYPEDSLWIAHQEMQQRYVGRLVVCGDRQELLGIITQTSLLRVLDPMEMSGVIEVLQEVVEKRTGELQEAIKSLKIANAQLASEIISRKRAEKRLLLLESVVVNARDAIIIMDEGKTDPSDPCIVYVNEAFTLMTGYTSEEIVGKNPSLLRGVGTDPAQIDKIRNALLQREPLRVEVINYRKDGSEYWVELNTVPVNDEQGNFSHWVSVQRDITDRKRMEQALFQEKELAQVTLQSIGDAVITTDATGKIEYLNPVAEKITGWSTNEARCLPINEVFKIVNEITREPVENTAKQALQTGKIVDLVNHCVLIARNGNEFAIDHSAAPIHASDGTIIGAVLVFRDSTQTRALARQLSWQASHDALTGLVNRREFENCLQEAVNTAKINNQNHVLCYLDLDRFKIVNDTCGHFAGDELLRQIAELFKNRVRKTDTLARVGGDEFALLLYQCNLDKGMQIANNILQSIQSFRFAWQDKTFSIGVSIGIVPITSDTENSSSILSAADAACYAAKDNGRNRVYVSLPKNREFDRVKGEMQWAVKINEALELEKFRLYYQPIIPLNNTSISLKKYYEVLLRLEDEPGQIISPMAFIPAAERYHLMHNIDRWVIASLFAMRYEELINKNAENIGLAQIDLGNSPLYIINLSGASINDDQFLDFLQDQFSLYQIPPQTICFEITETVAIANLTKASGLIRSLKDMGCRFSLDDFGSGMSSFAYLRNLPIDYLKIDGSFVKNIAKNEIDFAMIEAINRIGHVMGIQTIAEFVENAAILAKIQEVGVDYGQGYFLGEPRPLPITDLFSGNSPILSC